MRLTTKEMDKGQALWKLLCQTFKWDESGSKIPTHRRFQHPRMPWTEESGGFMDVVYEVVGGGAVENTENATYFNIAFAHVYTQEGDLMYSPEIVVRVFVYPGQIIAIPYEVTDHRMGLFRRAIDMDSGEIVSVRMVDQLFGLSNTVLRNIQAYNYGINE